MAFTLITGNSTTPVVLDGGDDFLLLPGASLVVTNEEALDVTGDVQNISVLGTLYTDGNAGTATIELHGDSNQVYIGPDGFVGNAITGTQNFFIPGDNNVVVNDGVISAGRGLLVSSGEGNSIVNNGSIHGLNGIGVWFFGSGDNRLENFGDISGGFQGSNDSDTVINAGTIQGDVDLGNGDDTYNGSGAGVVSGMVLGGSGNDTLRGSDAADSLDGGIASDLIVGRGGDDTLRGDTGADTIRGGDGNDNIDGEVNADLINGNAGDDTILGSGGDDTIRGGRDDDELRGGNGSDNIRGDSGDDLIIGGAARDDMFGGSGNDVFVFESTSDSGTGAARDRIFDFRSGEDTLDISALAGPQFNFIGSGNFTGSGPQVRAVAAANGTLIYIDADGDGTRDSDIYLIGTSSVVEGDFLL